MLYYTKLAVNKERTLEEEDPVKRMNTGMEDFSAYTHTKYPTFAFLMRYQDAAVASGTGLPSLQQAGIVTDQAHATLRIRTFFFSSLGPLGT